MPFARSDWVNRGFPAILAAYALPSRADSPSRATSEAERRRWLAGPPFVASGTVDALLNGCERITSWLKSARPFTGPRALMYALSWSVGSMSRSKDSSNEIALPTVSESTGVHGATASRLKAAYSGGNGWVAV